MLDNKNIPSDIIKKMINYIPKKRNKKFEVRAHCKDFNREINKDKFYNAVIHKYFQMSPPDANKSRINAKNALIELIIGNGWDTEKEELEDARDALYDSSSHLILSKKIRLTNDAFELAIALQSDIEFIDMYLEMRQTMPMASLKKKSRTWLKNY